jgi:hypothetical protein
MAQGIDDRAVRQAVDRTEIQELMARYTTAVDARRWELLDQVFIDGAPVDLTPNGGIKDEYPAIGTWIKDAMAGFAAYQHYLSNFSIAVDGDRATARFYVFTQMVTIVDGRDEIMSDGGFYDASFVRTPQGWRVAALNGGLVWWDDHNPEAPKPPWWGVSTDRFRGVAP